MAGIYPSGCEVRSNGKRTWIVCDEPRPEQPALRYGVTRAEWRRLRRQVLARDGGVCTYCGSRAQPLHCDHVLAFSRGGPTVLENLTTACAWCNVSKRDREQPGARP